MATKRVRASAVVVHNGKILCFFAEDPTSKKTFHFLPGGEIEKGESAPDTAVRETLEETGYGIRVATSSATDREYPFDWNGGKYESFTMFYRGYLLSPFQQPKEVKDAAYNKGVHWVDAAQVQEIFSYTPQIADAISELLRFEELAS